jgi:hypothetical protein
MASVRAGGCNGNDGEDVFDEAGDEVQGLRP